MRIIVIGILGLLLLSYYFFVRQPHSDSEQQETAVENPGGGNSGIIATVPSPDPKEDRPVRVLDIAKLAEKLHAENQSDAEDLEVVSTLIDYYRQLYKVVPPGGLNEEIVAALCGKNTKRLALISPKHPAISKRGELLDRHGTAYYFHPVSSSLIEIRSAGPDQKLFTKDDLTAE